MRHKILPLLAAVAALAVAVAACGGGGGDGQKVAVIASPQGLMDAAAHTAAAKTGHVEMSIGTGANGQDTRILATGAFDAESHLSSMSMDMSKLLSSLGTNELPGTSIEMVSTADTLYMKFPLFASLLDVHTEWMSMKAGSDASSFEVADPSAFLDFLRGSGGEVTDLGREQVRGVDTTHLHGSLKLRDALDSAPADQRERLQRAMDQLSKDGESLLDTTLPVDVWIDDDGLVRRLSMEFVAPQLSGDGDGGGQAAITIELFDFGTDVSIDLPPADQVTDVTAKFEQLNGVVGGG
jgi:hypothetical protein